MLNPFSSNEELLLFKLDVDTGALNNRMDQIVQQMRQFDGAMLNMARGVQGQLTTVYEAQEIRRAAAAGRAANLQAARDRAQVDSVNQVRRAYQQYIREVKDSYSEQTRHHANMVQGLSKIQSAFVGVGAASAVVFGGISRQFQDVMRTFGDFEEKVNRFKAISMEQGDSDAVINQRGVQISDKALSISRDSKFNAREILDASVAMGKLGFSADKVEASLQMVVNAAEATGVSVEKVGEIVSGVARGFGMISTDELQKVTDMMTMLSVRSAADIPDIGVAFKYVGPVAQATGQSLSDMAGIMEILNNHMIKGSTAGTSMRQALLRLAKQTHATVAALEAIDMKVTEVNGQFKTMPKIIMEMSNKLHGFNEQAKSATLAAVFGERAVTSMLALMEEFETKGEAAFMGVMEAYQDVEGMTDRMKGVAFQGLNAELAKLRASAEALAVSFGKIMAPLTTEFVSGIRTILDGVDSLSTEFKTVFVGAGGLVAGIAVLGIFTSALGLMSTQMVIGWTQLTRGLELMRNFGNAMMAITARTTTATAVLGAHTIGLRAMATAAIQAAPALIMASAYLVLIGAIVFNIVPFLMRWNTELKEQEASEAHILEIEAIRQERKGAIAEHARKEAEYAKVMKKEYFETANELYRIAGAFQEISANSDRNISRAKELKQLIQEQIDSAREYASQGRYYQPSLSIPDELDDFANQRGIVEGIFGPHTIEGMEEYKAKLDEIIEGETILAGRAEQIAKIRRAEAQERKSIETSITTIMKNQEEITSLVGEYTSSDSYLKKRELKAKIEEKINSSLEAQKYLEEHKGEVAAGDLDTRYKILDAALDTKDLEEKTMLALGQKLDGERNLLDLLKEQNDALKVQLATQQAIAEIANRQSNLDKSGIGAVDMSIFQRIDAEVKAKPRTVLGNDKTREELLPLLPDDPKAKKAPASPSPAKTTAPQVVEENEEYVVPERPAGFPGARANKASRIPGTTITRLTPDKSTPTLPSAYRKGYEHWLQQNGLKHTDNTMREYNRTVVPVQRKALQGQGSGRAVVDAKLRAAQQAARNPVQTQHRHTTARQVVERRNAFIDKNKGKAGLGLGGENPNYNPNTPVSTTTNTASTNYGKNAPPGAPRQNQGAGTGGGQAGQRQNQGGGQGGAQRQQNKGGVVWQVSAPQITTSQGTSSAVGMAGQTVEEVEVIIESGQKMVEIEEQLFKLEMEKLNLRMELADRTKAISDERKKAIAERTIAIAKETAGLEKQYSAEAQLLYGGLEKSEIYARAEKEDANKREMDDAIQRYTQAETAIQDLEHALSKYTKEADKPKDQVAALNKEKENRAVAMRDYNNASAKISVEKQEQSEKDRVKSEEIAKRERKQERTLDKRTAALSPGKIDDIELEREEAMQVLADEYEVEVREATKVGGDVNQITQNYLKDRALTYKEFSDKKKAAMREEAKEEAKDARELAGIRIENMQDGLEKELEAIKQNEKERIEDLKFRLEHEKDLTQKQRDDINAIILETEKKSTIDQTKAKIQQANSMADAVRDAVKSRIDKDPYLTAWFNAANDAHNNKFIENLEEIIGKVSAISMPKTSILNLSDDELKARAALQFSEARMAAESKINALQQESGAATTSALRRYEITREIADIEEEIKVIDIAQTQATNETNLQLMKGFAILQNTESVIAGITDNMSNMGPVFGAIMEGVKKKTQDVSSIFEGAIGGGTALLRVGANPADISAWMDLITNGMKLLNGLAGMMPDYGQMMTDAVSYEAELLKSDAEMLRTRAEYARENGDISALIFNKNMLRASAMEYKGELMSITADLMGDKDLQFGILQGLGDVFNLITNPSELLDKYGRRIPQKLNEAKNNQEKAKIEKERRDKASNSKYITDEAETNRSVYGSYYNARIMDAENSGKTREALGFKMGKDTMEMTTDALNDISQLYMDGGEKNFEKIQQIADTVINSGIEGSMNSIDALISEMWQNSDGRNMESVNEFTERMREITSRLANAKLDFEKGGKAFEKTLADMTNDQSERDINNNRKTSKFFKDRALLKLEKDTLQKELEDTLEDPTVDQLIKDKVKKRLDNLQSEFNDRELEINIDEDKFIQDLSGSIRHMSYELQGEKGILGGAKVAITNSLDELGVTYKQKLRDVPDQEGAILTQWAQEAQKILLEGNKGIIQSANDLNEKLRGIRETEAKNTADVYDDINTAREDNLDRLADSYAMELWLAEETGNDKTDIHRKYEAERVQIEIEHYESMADARRRDLQDYIQYQKDIAAASATGMDDTMAEIEERRLNIMFDEEYIKQRFKNDPGERDKQLKYLEAKKAAAIKESMKDIANSAIDDLEGLRDAREELFNEQTRTYRDLMEDNEVTIKIYQNQIRGLQAERQALEDQIDDKQRKFKKDDVAEFRKLLDSVNLDTEIRDALEYISNPIANAMGDPTKKQSLDASIKTALDAAIVKTDYLLQQAETARTLEQITPEEYYKRATEAYGIRARFAELAIGEIDKENQAEVERMKKQGATDDEIRIIRKRQLQEATQVQEVLANAYKDFQDARLEQIAAEKKDEIEAIDDRIAAREHDVNKLEQTNAQAQINIDKFAAAAEADYKKINEQIRLMRQYTDEFIFKLGEGAPKVADYIEQIKTKFSSMHSQIFTQTTATNGVFDAFTGKFVTFKTELSKDVPKAPLFTQIENFANSAIAKMEKLKALLVDGSAILPPSGGTGGGFSTGGGGGIIGTNTSSGSASTASSSSNKGTGNNYIPIVLPGLGTKYLDPETGSLSDTLSFKAPTRKVTSDGFTILSTGGSTSTASKKSDKKHSSSPDRDAKVARDKAASSTTAPAYRGYASGRTPEAFRTPSSRVGGASDYMLGLFRNDEVIAPQRNFNSFAQQMRYDGYKQGQRWGSGGGSSFAEINIYAENVYGEMDMKDIAHQAIREANKATGVANANYLIGNN